MTRIGLSIITALTLALAGVNAQTPASRHVAITIDDGPVVNEMTDLGNFQRITNGLIGSFQIEKVPVTIFVNERQLNVPGQRDARAAVVEQWLDAGFDVGNHAYSHKSASNVPVDQFQDDVVKGEVITRALLEQRGKQLTWLRYPYLHSGATEDAHQAIVNFLEQRKYRVAPVTVDYADYTFAGAYTRELRRGNIASADRIKQAYLDQVDVGFNYARTIFSGAIRPRDCANSAHPLQRTELRVASRQVLRGCGSGVTRSSASTRRCGIRPTSGPTRSPDLAARG